MKYSKGDKVKYVGTVSSIPVHGNTFVEHPPGYPGVSTIRDSNRRQRNVYTKNIVLVITNNKEAVRLLDKEY